jgi:hypothetical protein
MNLVIQYFNDLFLSPVSWSAVRLTYAKGLFCCLAVDCRWHFLYPSYLIMAKFDDGGLTSASLLLLSWSSLSFAIRVWVKLRKSDGWDMDDTVTSAAFVGVQLLISGFELTEA